MAAHATALFLGAFRMLHGCLRLPPLRFLGIAKTPPIVPAFLLSRFLAFQRFRLSALPFVISASPFPRAWLITFAMLAKVCSAAARLAVALAKAGQCH
jgi:hypothetical protein